MGRGTSTKITSPAPRRIKPTYKGFAALMNNPRFQGWHQCNNSYRRNREQLIFTSLEGLTISDLPLLPAFRTKRNVSLAIEWGTEHLIVWEEILHPRGNLGHRHDCGTNPELAVSVFRSCLRRMQNVFSDIGTMPDQPYTIDRQFLESLIASRFRRDAYTQIRGEIEARKRRVEKEAVLDRDALAAELLDKSGYSPELLNTAPLEN